MALKVNDILDQVDVLIADTNSKPQRQRLLVWMNDVIKSIADMRDWDFLTDTEELTITNNSITYPADFKEFINLSIGDQYFFDRTSILTDSESWVEYGITTADFTVPVTEGTATLKYKILTPVYAVGATTIFPDQFINVVVDGILCKYYRFIRAYEDLAEAKNQYSNSLIEIKKNYNRNQPMPKYTRHGYLRRRQ